MRARIEKLSDVVQRNSNDNSKTDVLLPHIAIAKAQGIAIR